MILKIHITLTYSYTKLTHYLPSTPFLSKSASYPDISFSLISPAQSVYTKYTLKKAYNSKPDIIMDPKTMVYTLLDQNLDLKWGHEIATLKSLDFYLDH